MSTKEDKQKIESLCNALNKIMEIEMGIAMEYRVNVEDSEIYCIAEEAIKNANPAYFLFKNKEN